MTQFEMTADEMKAIRKGLGLSTIALGRALGYSGNDNTTSVLIRKYESGGRPIPEWIGRLVKMFGRHGIPAVFSEDADERDQSIDELQADERRLFEELRANNHAQIGDEYMAEQAKLFDLGWAQRDRAAYDAHKAKCDAIRARHRAALAASAATMDRIEDVMRLLKIAEAKRAADEKLNKSSDIVAAHGLHHESGDAFDWSEDRQPSLARRLHDRLGHGGEWQGSMTYDEQKAFFGITLSYAEPSVVQISLDATGMPVVVAKGSIEPLDNRFTINDIQGAVENQEELDSGGGWHDDYDDLTPDYYRVFPREKSAFVKIENKVSGFSEVVIATEIQEAKDNFARYHGYGDWAELMSLVPSEGWTAEWDGGDPEESRLASIERLTKEREGLLGDPDAHDRLAEVDQLLEMYTYRDTLKNQVIPQS